MKNHSENQAIVVDDIYKSFKLPHEQHSGLKQLLVTFFRRRKGYEIQQVLRGVSFEVKKGEFFGIVGRNGSGKSTLLKLIAGIYTPNKGSVKINGSLTPFIELGVGFNPDLTGRENVFLNGALLGFSNDEMKKMWSLPNWKDSWIRDSKTILQVCRSVLPFLSPFEPILTSLSLTKC